MEMQTSDDEIHADGKHPRVGSRGIPMPPSMSKDLDRRVSMSLWDAKAVGCGISMCILLRPSRPPTAVPVT